MARRVKLHMREGVAMVTLAAAEGGPSKAVVFDLAAGFDGATRTALAGALDVALTDQSVQVIVLRSGPLGWPCAPADPAADYRPVDGVPDLKDLAARIAGAQKPVIAALSGRISGGALAISQAAGWRLATPDTVFAALEPGLGYLPGGGGLVEIARRLGASAALDFVLSGRSWNAQEAAEIGLIDGLVEGSADGACIALAKMLVSGKPVPPSRSADAGLADAGAYLASVAAARSRSAAWVSLGLPARAVHRIIDVVEAGLLLPHDELNDFEAVALADLLDAPLAKSLRYQAAAMARTATLAGLVAVPSTDQSGGARADAVGARGVALWHCGGVTDGGLAGDAAAPYTANGLAISALGRLAGRLAEQGPVRLGAASESDIEELFGVVARRHAAQIEAGTAQASDLETAWARIEPCTREGDLTGGPRDVAAAGIAGSAAQWTPDWAVVSPPVRGAASGMQLAHVAQALTKSGLDAGRSTNTLPKFLLDTGRACDCVVEAAGAQTRAVSEDKADTGLADTGWGDGVWGVIRLGARVAELALPSGIGAAQVQPVVAALRAAGMVVVRGGGADPESEARTPAGGIAERMQAALLLAAERLAIAGAAPAQIDRVLEAAGFGEGPFRRLDRAGTPATLTLLRRAGRAPGVLISEWTGGFYAVANAPRPDAKTPNAQMSGAQIWGGDDLAADGLSAALDLVREGRRVRRPSDGQILARVVAELAGEGAALLQERGAHRPSDIDLVMALDCGMRAEVGGPMHMADGIGLLAIRTQLRALAAEGARAPVTLWDVLIKNGRKFADLNAR